MMWRAELDCQNEGFGLATLLCAALPVFGVESRLDHDSKNMRLRVSKQ
jgi:hypothetical protein